MTAGTALRAAPLRIRPPGRTIRLVAVTLVCAVAAIVLGVTGIVVGSSGLTVPDVLRTLVGQGSGADSLIVLEFRMPRVAGALLVGAALGLAGALTQTFARNPLATPDILGVTSGASLGGVVAILVGGGSYAVSGALLGIGVPGMAALGAVVAAALVYGLSWRGGIDSYRTILVGIGATAVFGGITSWLLVRAQITQAVGAAHWLVGSLNGIAWASVAPVALALAVVVPIALLQTRDLDASTLGDELSTGLGVAVQRHRLVLIGCAVVLTAAAVSAAGPVEFVAFVAPQIARRIAGTARPPLVAATLLGAVIVVGADALARGILPDETPVGIVTVVIGAPYLIWLLARRARVAS